MATGFLGRRASKTRNIWTLRSLLIDKAQDKITDRRRRGALHLTSAAPWYGCYTKAFHFHEPLLILVPSSYASWPAPRLAAPSSLAVLAFKINYFKQLSLSNKHSKNVLALNNQRLVFLTCPWFVWTFLLIWTGLHWAQLGSLTCLHSNWKLVRGWMS